MNNDVNFDSALIAEISSAINEQLNKTTERVIVAIDGCCGSGKTTLATFLQKLYACSLIHMDDFFLRPEQRTAERLNTPGENIDHERFLNDVLKPLSSGESVCYRPYCCTEMSLGTPVQVLPTRLCVVEGSYSCHPNLWEYYNVRIFVSVDKEEQLRRIELRNGKEVAERFESVWIPLEEQYFSFYNIKEKCQITIET